MGVDASFWRGRRVLITGHNGFKGSWLTLWLLSMGSEVKGLSLDPPAKLSLWNLAQLGDEVECHAVNILDIDAVEHVVKSTDPEVIFHLAAQPLVRRAYLEPRETLAINVLGTANVLDAARRAEALQVVINVTSDKCYENRELDRGYREDEPMGGSELYSASKGCSELVTAAYRRSFFTSGNSAARIASARAGNVIGGGDWGEDRLVPDFIRGALAGEVLAIRNPDAVRPWQHVVNPISGYLLLAEAAWKSAEFATAFNFGPLDEDARPVRAVVERLCELWPETVKIENDPGPHPDETMSLRLDSTSAHMHLNWQPSCTLDQALETTVQWHLAQRDGADMKAVTCAQIENLTQ